LRDLSIRLRDSPVQAVPQPPAGARVAVNDGLIRIMRAGTRAGGPVEPADVVAARRAGLTRPGFCATAGLAGQGETRPYQYNPPTQRCP
jgi:hypothetical protein